MEAMVGLLSTGLEDGESGRSLSVAIVLPVVDGGVDIFL